MPEKRKKEKEKGSTKDLSDKLKEEKRKTDHKIRTGSGTWG